MKKTLLSIALAAATMPLTFAQTTPATPPPNSTTKPAVTAKTKKNHKKHNKNAVPANSGSGAAAVKPAK
jgi:hypothetical protein